MYFFVHGCFQSFFVGVALLFLFEHALPQQPQFPLQPQEPLFFFIFIIAKITAAIRIIDIIIFARLLCKNSVIFFSFRFCFLLKFYNIIVKPVNSFFVLFSQLVLTFSAKKYIVNLYIITII